MHWKPAKKTVELATPARPSRIRREPVQLNPNTPARPQRPVNYRERDMYLGIVGILVFAAAIGTAIVALAIFTVLRDDPAADARYVQFNQCYAAAGPNCVEDGGTIYMNGTRIAIAGIEAPGINDAKCDGERDRGVGAATLLAMVLNSGPVTVGSAFVDQSGRTVHKVEVKGRDVARTMIDQDVAHEAGSGLSWCH